MLKPFVSISCALPLCAVFVFAMPAVLVSAEPATTSQVLVECRHTGGLKIEIDGRLDDAAWKLAQPLTNFTVLRSEGKQPAKHPTTARLLWDDEFLYIAFSCEADDIRTHIYNHDGPVWIAEAVESFLAPRGADAPYYEINYNPLNVVFDCRIEDWHMSEIGKHGMKWAAGFNPRVRSATWLDRDANGRIVGWSLEAAVPFADLDLIDRKPPQPGATWLFNVYRCAMQADGRQELSHWQPVQPDFHRPHNFPRVVFVKK